MKYWFVATYKINEIKKVEINLQNQQFEYYLPKILIQKPNRSLKEEVMFPGYIFINAGVENFSAIKYTLGIKKIIRFGKSISYMTDNEIKKINMLEKSSRSKPIVSDFRIGQEVYIKSGSFKGNIAKICKLPSKKRVGILLYLLGSMRKLEILQKHLSL